MVMSFVVEDFVFPQFRSVNFAEKLYTSRTALAHVWG